MNQWINEWINQWINGLINQTAHSTLCTQSYSCRNYGKKGELGYKGKEGEMLYI